VKAAILKNAWEKLVQMHHEAFLVQTYGQAASGISPERVQELLEAGVLDPADLGGVILPGMENTLDPLSFMYRVSKVVEKSPFKDRQRMREWSLDQWKVRVDQSIEEEPEAPVVLPKEGIQVETPEAPSTEQPPSVLREDIPTPDWMTTPIAAAYQEALERAGEYARGLGNTLSAETGAMLEEVWGDQDIQEEADPVLRDERVQIIRDAVAQALATHRDYGELALELARLTGKYSHNWDRIARTELQGAYNEGVFLEAIEDWGDDAYIARVTETNACRHCLRLFRDGEGRPAVFAAAELLANGTNVGKKPEEWLPTVWPLHPNCRCDTMAVPPGMVVNAEGVLEMRR